MKKILFVVRHAHREKNKGSDNGLSEKGQGQAKDVAKYLVSALKACGVRENPSEEVILLSSPKLRCQETLFPISEKLRIELMIDKNLDEGGRLQEKVAQFIEYWKSTDAPKVTIICSHGDLIPELIDKLTGVYVGLSKGALAEIEWSGEKGAQLKAVLQEL